MLDLSLGLTILFGIVTLVAFFIGIRSYRNAKSTSTQLKYIEEKISLPEEVEQLKKQRDKLDEEIERKRYARLMLELIEIDAIIARKSKEREEILLRLPSLVYLKKPSTTYDTIKSRLEIKRKASSLIYVVSIIVAIISVIIAIVSWIKM